MDFLGSIIRFLITYIGYPLLIVSILGYIFDAITDLIKRSGNIRVVIASLLPVVVLVFLVVSDREKAESLTSFIMSRFPGLRFAIGALLGLILIEVGNRVDPQNTEIGAALYALYLSTIGVFIVYCLMSGLLSTAHLFLFGLVLGGGLYAVFRGFPNLGRIRKRGSA